MVWLLTKSTHHQAIGPWVRSWLKGSATDRLIQISTPGLVWAMLWAILAYAGDAEAIFFLIGLAPWYFWALDAIVDRYATGGEIGRLMARDDVALATRAEYVGGHPQLPHGRFAYLTIRGHQQDPTLTIWFPGQQDEGHCFDIPLLDISKTAPKADKEQSPTETLLATLDERAGGLFGGERVTLNVDYQGAGGRKHRVEFTSFFRGPDEIRNWRNYLVCAQAEADTGITPFGPWKSLKPAPEEVRSDDGARDGDKVSAERRAFERR